jgi:hypothetical protein
MLDIATVVDPTLNHDDEARDHKPDHQQSLHGDSASSLTPLEECGRSRDQDDRDFHDNLHDRDASDRIENRCQEHDHLEQEQHEERDNNFYGPYYDQPHQQRSPEGGGGAMQEESRLFSMT